MNVRLRQGDNRLRLACMVLNEIWHKRSLLLLFNEDEVLPYCNTKCLTKKCKAAKKGFK